MILRLQPQEVEVPDEVGKKILKEQRKDDERRSWREISEHYSTGVFTSYRLAVPVRWERLNPEIVEEAA